MSKIIIDVRIIVVLDEEDRLRLHMRQNRPMLVPADIEKQLKLLWIIRKVLLYIQQMPYTYVQ
jgi:hypothetical protein